MEENPDGIDAVLKEFDVAPEQNQSDLHTVAVRVSLLENFYLHLYIQGKFNEDFPGELSGQWTFYGTNLPDMWGKIKRGLEAHEIPYEKDSLVKPDSRNTHTYFKLMLPQEEIQGLARPPSVVRMMIDLRDLYDSII